MSNGIDVTPEGGPPPTPRVCPQCGTIHPPVAGDCPVRLAKEGTPQSKELLELNKSMSRFQSVVKDALESEKIQTIKPIIDSIDEMSERIKNL